MKRPKFDLTIDKNALDEEWLNQPSAFKQAADWAALARKEFDEAKSDCEVVKADVSRKVRADPDAYDIERISESAIAAAVLLDDEVQQAMGEVRDKRYTLDLMESAVKSMDHKKTALSKLVDLHLASYFSKPRESEQAREHIGDMKKDTARSKTRRRLNLDKET